MTGGKPYAAAASISSLSHQYNPQEGSTSVGDSFHTDLSGRRRLAQEAERHSFAKGDLLLPVKSSALRIASRLLVRARGRGCPQGDPGREQTSTAMTWPLALDTTQSIESRVCEQRRQLVDDASLAMILVPPKREGRSRAPL